MKTARKGRQSAYISIRSKLVAAVAMLLVASFMVVSSSYAWFTLSTAPEVKGIQTTVGANGNLEIALYTGDPVAQSGLGDAGNSETWGNLINLSDAKYGLASIKLYPARLNTDGTKITVGSPLKTPEYAADGRIKALAENTLFGSFNTQSSSFMEFDKTSTSNKLEGTNNEVLQTRYGVRGIGNSNGLTPQQLDYRNAIVAITSAKSSVKNYASLSLSGGAGSKLASIAADRATTGANSFDLTAIEDMLNKLESALAQVDLMALNFVRAAVASEQATEDAEDYAKYKADFYDNTKISTELAGWVATYTTAPYNYSELAALWTYRTGVANALTASRTAYDAQKVAGNIQTATWEETTAILTGLVDMNAVTINDIKVSELTAKDEATGEFKHMNELMNAVMSTGLYVTIMPPAATDSNPSPANGVYIDLANISGNIQSNIHLEKISYNGLSVGPIEAKMKTNVTGAPTVDLTATDKVPTEPTNQGVEGAATINDLYGYIIDLAFRTNAADSDLMLQTTPKNRIYSTDVSNAETMGLGSTMAFAATETFTEAQVTGLMQHIRIVFADVQGTIYAVGGLDVSSTTTVEGKIAASIRLYDQASYDFVDGRFTVVGESLRFIEGENAKIFDMPQNQQVNLSVYVYLDGDSVQNKDVATEGQLEGLLNLQFSSSASLIPMEYNPLRTQAGADAEGN